MTMTANTAEAADVQPGLFKRARATVCKHCPACKQARKDPESLVGRVLHHPRHAERCPVWKAYQEINGEQKGDQS
jgi:hypothetical protein